MQLKKSQKDPKRFKWSEIWNRVTINKPNQSEITIQIWLKKSQWRKRWAASSRLPHPPTQDWEVVGITPLLNKLSFVGRKLRRRRHTKDWFLKEHLYAILQVVNYNVMLSCWLLKKIVSSADKVIFWRMLIPPPHVDNNILQNNKVQQITTLPQLYHSFKLF